MPQALCSTTVKSPCEQPAAYPRPDRLAPYTGQEVGLALGLPSQKCGQGGAGVAQWGARNYTRSEWLDVVPTNNGGFIMNFAAVALNASRIGAWQRLSGAEMRDDQADRGTDQQNENHDPESPQQPGVLHPCTLHSPDSSDEQSQGEDE